MPWFWAHCPLDAAAHWIMLKSVMVLELCRRTFSVLPSQWPSRYPDPLSAAVREREAGDRNTATTIQSERRSKTKRKKGHANNREMERKEVKK